MIRSQDAFTCATRNGACGFGTPPVFAFDVVVAQPLRPKPTVASAVLDTNARRFIEDPSTGRKEEACGARIIIGPVRNMRFTAGDRIGVYEIRSALGAGGMGEVYRAFDPRLNREVALKVLLPAAGEHVEALVRFEREARAVAALSHPNILAIHDFGTDRDVAYAVMELLDGDTLRERLVSGRLPVRKAIDYATQIALGLAAAHERGVVHRDLKPENIALLPDGRVKILDFGLARQMPWAATASIAPTTPIATSAGTVLGTVGYMAPEQVRGDTADARSDIFAFGAVLY